ncbi:IPT/TIG domain-containing protein [Mucilaginibacter mali]|uniref:IPT/TIG domain-containing protein n=1 Tax=Mucilaginibacter mali TaxID=2740462 RepID=A0A7D4TK69_9SPHI|nr:IPT/TIG domain-containing protein [Mucilaginibacter mali]QKJ28573.1 IPT/TIG domain-containing protein [Mucilaginibacter mali]
MKKHLLLFFIILIAVNGFAQTITSFAPTSATPGTMITITGTNLAGTTSVSFGGVAGLGLKVVSSTSVTAIVPVTGSGDVSVTSVGGSTATLGGFTYIPSSLPVIVSVSAPMPSTLGRTITILGVNLRSATAVTFGGVPALIFAPYGLDPDRALVATVGLGATGDIAVTTPSGTATMPGFTYVANTKPYITSITPSSAAPGQTITISGYNLGSVGSVTIGEVAALSFSVISPTSITAVVGPGYSNHISFDGPGGNGVEGIYSFTLTVPSTPTISTFSPASATPGTTVTITGTNLAGTTGVSFGGVKAAIYKVVSATTVTAMVPVTSSGDVAITNAGGTATAGGFTYIPSSAPTIAYVDAMSGTLGRTITILGVNLRTATSVTFGGMPALNFAPYGLDPDHALLATVGLGATGDVVVTNPAGTSAVPGFAYTPSTSPYITSIVPSYASPGQTITINGYNLGGITSVKIGGEPALSFSVVSPTSITAVIGPGHNNSISFNDSGNNADGSYTFTLTPPSAPTITSFTPTSATPGSTVTITGTNLSGTTGVSFGGVASMGYKIINATTVTAIVPITTSGLVSVTNGGGTVTAGGFTYIPSSLPVITSMSSPMPGTLGRDIYLIGVNLRTATSVTFGGVPALNFSPYGLDPDHALVATVGLGATGDIVVTTPSGTATWPGFTYTPSTTPYVTSVVPSSGPPGTTITINGYNLGGVTSVTIGEVPALNFNVLSSTTITAVVGPGYDNIISFKGPGGDSPSYQARFTITNLPAPTITSFSPTSATPGSTVTITGTDFTGATAVNFGGVAANLFTVVSPTSITAVVGPGGASGDVSVSTYSGTGAKGGFTYIPVPAPSITSVTPTSATPGTTVTISGTNFTGATAVTFGGLPATSFTVVSPTSITAVVGSATSGSITVTTFGGTATLSGFTYTQAPFISSFGPVAATAGATITITGLNFTGTSAVSFGGTAASSFTVVSPTSITAIAGAGASGAVSVINANGTATKTGFVYVAAPVITPAGSTEINIGSSVALSTAANSNYSYQWYKDGIAITTAGTTNAYTATESGAYKVTIASNGISLTSDAVNVHASLAPSNFTTQATSVVCKGSANGTIKITAGVNLPYTVKVLSNNIPTTTYSFTNSVTIPNLPAGTYNLYINITGYTYEQYFSIKVTEPKDLSVYSALNKNTNSLALTLDGGTTYNIKVNGVDYNTTGSNITLPLTKGVNNISVTTDKPCQGIVEKRIVIGDNITAYPNPFEGNLTLNLGDKVVGQAQVQVFNSSGKQVFSKEYTNQSGEVTLDLSTLEHTQIYILKLTVDNTEYINKIIKK